MFDEVDPTPGSFEAVHREAAAEPVEACTSAGLGIMLATESPGDLDDKSRDQVTSRLIGRVREETALRKLRAAFQSEAASSRAGVAEPDGSASSISSRRAWRGQSRRSGLDHGRAGAVRPDRAARPRNQGPGREASAVRHGRAAAPQAAKTGRISLPNSNNGTFERCPSGGQSCCSALARFATQTYALRECQDGSSKCSKRLFSATNNAGLCSVLNVTKNYVAIPS